MKGSKVSSPNSPKSRSDSPSKLRKRKSNHHDGKASMAASDETRSGAGPKDDAKKWKNWRERTRFTFLMIGGFFAVIAMGPLSIMLLVFCLQVLIYREVISLATVPKKELDLPWARAMNAYFLVCTEFYLYGQNFRRLMQRHPWIDAHLQPVFAHHKFTSFSLYLIGFVWFVGTLRKGHYRFQMGQFAWTHMALIFIVVLSQYMIENIFEGIFWFFLPIALVIVNDIFAYVFGFFFGRHQLIELSPKKTWEGYIGGGLTTMAFGFLFTSILSDWNFMICPPQSLRMTAFSSVTCEPNPVFVASEYRLPAALAGVLSAVFRASIQTVWIKPVQFHSLAISAFASLIAPFGGFFASGVKRAFNIKDFGNSIPGHGGVTDRFDCQFMMAAFSHTYYSSFIKISTVTVAALYAKFVKLDWDKQIELYHSVQEYLDARGAFALPNGSVPVATVASSA